MQVQILTNLICRERLTRYIFTSPGLASCRCRPLSSNVRHHVITICASRRLTSQNHIVHSVVGLQFSRFVGTPRGSNSGVPKFVAGSSGSPFGMVAVYHSVIQHCLASKYCLGASTPCLQPGHVMPNPSLTLSPNSKSPGPRYSAGVHFLQRGPGASLPVPA